MIRPTRILRQTFQKFTNAHTPGYFRHDVKNLYPKHEMDAFFNSERYLYVNREVFNPQDTMCVIIFLIGFTKTTYGLVRDKAAMDEQIAANLKRFSEMEN